MTRDFIQEFRTLQTSLKRTENHPALRSARGKEEQDLCKFMVFAQTTLIKNDMAFVLVNASAELDAGRLEEFVSSTGIDNETLRACKAAVSAAQDQSVQFKKRAVRGLHSDDSDVSQLIGTCRDMSYDYEARSFADDAFKKIDDAVALVRIDQAVASVYSHPDNQSFARRFAAQAKPWKAVDEFFKSGPGKDWPLLKPTPTKQGGLKFGDDKNGLVTRKTDRGITLEPHGNCAAIVRIKRLDDSGKPIDAWDTFEFKNGKIVSAIISPEGKSQVADLKEVTASLLEQKQQGFAPTSLPRRCDSRGRGR